MHPKSRDRSGNDKLIADTEKSRKPARSGSGRRHGRQSKYGRKLEAIKFRKAIREAYGQSPDAEIDADALGLTAADGAGSADTAQAQAATDAEEEE